ncbi:MAG: hypothetical protein V3U91_04850 [Candidatus Aminicenantaceae bacterium]
MVVDHEGSEIDWHVGYNPPPDSMLAKLEDSAKGIDTFKSLSDQYAKDPNEAEVVIKLGLKYLDLYQVDKALEKLKEGVALDPTGKTREFTSEIGKARVTYTEFAEYQIAIEEMYSGEERDPEPLKAFIKKYPESEMLKRAYGILSRAISRGPKEEAEEFYKEYAKKYPDDPVVLGSWLSFIVRTKEDLDKGVELAEKIHSLTRYKSVSPNNQKLADLYLLKEDKLMADQVYGKDFIESRARIFALDLTRYADYWTGKNDNFESVEEMLELALQIQPGDTLVLSRAVGSYVKMDKEDKALELFGPSFLKRNLSDSNNLWSYANFWAQQGKNLDSALEAATALVKLAPEEYSSWDVLSTVYQKKKNFSQAIKASEKALELADGSMKEYMQRKLDQAKAAAKKEKK